MSSYRSPGQLEREIYYCDGCNRYTFFERCWACDELVRPVARFASHYALWFIAFVLLCALAYVGIGWMLLPRVNLDWARYYRLVVVLCTVSGAVSYLLRWHRAAMGSFAGQPSMLIDGATNCLAEELNVMEATLDAAIHNGDKAQCWALLDGFDHLDCIACSPKIDELRLRCMAALPISLETHRRLEDACSIEKLPPKLDAASFCTFVEQIAETFPDLIGLRTLKLYMDNNPHVTSILHVISSLHTTLLKGLQYDGPRGVMRMNRVLLCMLSLSEAEWNTLKQHGEANGIDMVALQSRMRKTLIADLKASAGGASKNVRDRQISLDDRRELKALMEGMSVNELDSDHRVDWGNQLRIHR